MKPLQAESGLRRRLRSLSWMVTREIALRQRTRGGLHLVCEFPKSGGTWLSRMIAAYLDIPFPQQKVVPVLGPAVVHNHWLYDERMTNPLYVYRDGRDVMVSLYFHRWRVNRDQRRYRGVLAESTESIEVRRHLPRFLEVEMSKPLSSRRSWAEHVENWMVPGKDGVLYVAYESLLSDAHRTVKQCLYHLAESSLDDRRLDRIVNDLDFQSVSGRSRGTEEPSSFMRKGIAGDWKNYFTRDAAAVFTEFAGETLILLGYERDDTWQHSL